MQRGLHAGANRAQGRPRPEYKAHRIMDAAEKDSIETILSSDEAFQTEEQQRTKKEQPPLNFDLTTLQKRANSLWSWSAKRTLGVAQDLYDKFKLTTYPRTDSKHLEDMHETVAKTIDQLGDKAITPSMSSDFKRTDYQPSGISTTRSPTTTPSYRRAKPRRPPRRRSRQVVRPHHADFLPMVSGCRMDGHQANHHQKQDQFLKEVEALATSGWRAVAQEDKVRGGVTPSNPCDATLVPMNYRGDEQAPNSRKPVSSWNMQVST